MLSTIPMLCTTHRGGTTGGGGEGGEERCAHLLAVAAAATALPHAACVAADSRRVSTNETYPARDGQGPTRGKVLKNTRGGSIAAHRLPFVHKHVTSWSRDTGHNRVREHDGHALYR